MSPDHAPWISALEADAPDVIACRRVFDWSAASIAALQQELHDRVVTGSAPRLLAQQEAIGDALEAVMRSLPEPLLRAPGGEEDWNVAQAFAHTTAARRFLVTWAALDVDGRWPEHRPPTVTPSVPGRPDATREELLVLLDKSRRAVREAATKLEGHEVQTCRMDHPLIGNLRCGDWLMFIGVHDIMHLEQLDRLARQAADA
ncbi:MAG TPA: DinB family protein [Candidatus Limnocylindria bacterium]|nr:DinB family protein [Candidatus Limnocylindria bacterium]